jgi:hypothetical protein
MVLVSFLESPIEESDVKLQVIDNTTPSSILLPDRVSIGVSLDQVVAGSVSMMNGAGELFPSICLEVKIGVGTIQPAMLARDDWSFGFSQAIVVDQLVIEYAGEKTNTGSVRVVAMSSRNRSDTVFPEPAEGPGGEAARPFTRPIDDRFQYFASMHTIECKTADAPGFKVPKTVKNTASGADNHLQSVSDMREICCLLIVEDRRIARKLQIIGHSIWSINLSFGYKWRRSTPKPIVTNLSQVSAGKFVFGPPQRSEYSDMLNPTFYNGASYNKRASESLTRHIQAMRSSGKLEWATRLPEVPADFFI